MSFHFLNSVFCRAGVFNFKKAQLLFFLSCAFGSPSWIFIVLLVQFTELTITKGLEGRMQKKATSSVWDTSVFGMKNKAAVSIRVYRLLGKWPFLWGRDLVHFVLIFMS